MATTWNLSGEYCETCNCDFLCPCLPSNLAARPTRGECFFLFGFDIAQGRYGSVSLAPAAVIDSGSSMSGGSSKR